MKLIQRFFFIKAPSAKMIKRLEKVAIGDAVDTRTKDGYFFIKTNGANLAGEVVSELFPKPFTREVTYLQAYEELKTWEDKLE